MVTLRDARPSDAPFLADCILAVHPDFRRMGIGHALLEDGIRIGLSEGYTRIALVADAGMPHLIGLYQSIGFVPADHRHVFGTDFLRMVYSARGG